MRITVKILLTLIALFAFVPDPGMAMDMIHDLWANK